MEEQKAKVVILGSGPAGCTAAIYAHRAGLEPVLISGNEPGGQLMITTDVENWPGGIESLQGPDLMLQMHEHVKRAGVTWIRDEIVGLEKEQTKDSANPHGLFVLEGEKKRYKCEAVIVATGAKALYLGLESETKYLGKGVSACATCDGFFFRGKPVAVIGGGNTAVEEALFLCNMTSVVHFVHRRDTLRAEKILQDRLFAREAEGKVVFHWNKEVDTVLGSADEQSVVGLKIKPSANSSDENDKEESLDLEGVFIAIGHKPSTEIFDGVLTMNEAGYIDVGGDLSSGVGGVTATSVPGIFAAGDVMDSHYRQAVTSAGTGCMAALDAEKYLSN